MTRPLVPPLASEGRLVLDESELRQWGIRFGQATEAPLIVTLSGELGAGKTTLAQAICSGYGVTDAVTSPTYALVHEYSSPRSVVFHIDLYRLESEAQLTNIGWDEIVNGEALVIVEWPERAGERLPPHVPIAFEYEPGDSSRRILL
ncbi:MAG: tRNA (adenosine(37)-N6)-threonylcarbamoyltransferase complex ATPase subunit type 1 TsaE, partial [Vicinamibacterales bacterium]|nr:tRNA (adenosine(37)-N6)-threonylcarbamoyltransferase complex ATPase subunit type 1 TsaE [Vicinamibacterales bacterium]